MTKIFKLIIAGLFTLTLAGLAWFIYTVVTGADKLPILGEPGHTAGPFSFTNQSGHTITERTVEGKTTVIEYFFTTCPGICKIMAGNLSQVYQTFKDRPDFAILSHTVDPGRDSVPVLAAYAQRHHAAEPVWQFLTGDNVALYTAAREDYKLSLGDPRLEDPDQEFIHTEYVALLDKQRRIRGFYDATNKESIQKMIGDIKTLLKEE